MEVIEFSNALNILADENHDLLGSEVDVLRNEHGIDAPDSLQNALKKISEQGRLLNIGIVGRVKAGKSSLLNAIFFNGNTILPKAATPMTAALTTLSYGEEFSASVEFYSQADLEGIKERAQLYSLRLSEKEEKLYKELLDRQNKIKERTGNIEINERDIRAKAKKEAEKELQKDISLSAAHDQASKINSSRIDLKTLEEQSNIKASSPEALAEQLIDYVGANGSYMPFTKIVHISMPLEELRDIQVIDTPGLNDPVQSREERTIELLKTCDAVFIVSPAHSFLTDHDLEMMSRISAKEGIQELVLVSSQIDSSLYGSEKRMRLSEALENLQEKLTSRVSVTLSSLKRTNPEVGSVFDTLINSPAEHLLHTSGIAYSLASSLERSDKWDETESHTWGLLAHNYPDFFSLDNTETSKNSLHLLANIASIRERLAIVRSKKDKIVAERLEKLIDAKLKGLEAFRADLIKLAEQQSDRVQKADIGDLTSQLRSLDSMRKKLNLKVDPIYEGCLGEYRSELRKSLIKEARNLLGVTTEKVEQSGGVDTETGSREKKGLGSWFARKLWGGGSETYQVTVHTVITGQVANAINKFIADVTHHLAETSEKSKRVLDKELARSLAPAIDEILNDDYDSDMIFEAIRSVINSLPDDLFDLGIKLPSTLKARGTLRDYEAEQYKDEAGDFISEMDSQVTQKVDRFIRDIKTSTPLTVSDAFVDDLEIKIMSLKEQKANVDHTIARLQVIMAKLNVL